MEPSPSKRRKTMTKEITKSAAELEAMPIDVRAMPNEILVKLFNFLPNHDICCGVSLVCKLFYTICHDESLVPVKDLCINGGKKREWKLINIDAVSDIINQSKNLTFLKINGLNPEIATSLVSIALQSCPKLTHLEIVEQIDEYFESKNLDLKHNHDLLCTIKKLGKDLSSIKLLIVDEDDDFPKPLIDFIIDGCPKLKTLTLESVREWKNSHLKEAFDLIICKEALEALYKECKELKDLKLTNVSFEDIFTEDEIKKILPGCNVEIKECYFKQVDDEDDYEWTTEDSSDSDDV